MSEMIEIGMEHVQKSNAYGIWGSEMSPLTALLPSRKQCDNMDLHWRLNFFEDS